jgi:hypothetical protein
MSTQGLLRDFLRVSDANIVCPICGRPDWCCVKRDGTVALCARTESNEPYGDAGWLHPLTNYVVPPATVRDMDVVPRNWASLHNACRNRATAERVQALAIDLGVMPRSLRRLGVGWWGGEYWTFPIQDANRVLVGIQRRYPNGDKRTMKGSHLGLLIPNSFRYGEPVWLFEGASDTATGLDLGLNAVGRLSCSCGRNVAAQLCAGVPVVIVADTGHPNEIKGAQRLERELQKHCPKTQILYPPEKDFREWRTKVGDDSCLMSRISSVKQRP